jgi:hypothetical protein
MSRNIKINEWAVAEDVLRLREEVAKLERENSALLKALKEIAAYGPDDGCCGYGCDTPSIAMAAIDAAREKEAKP